MDSGSRRCRVRNDDRDISPIRRYWLNCVLRPVSCVLVPVHPHLPLFHSFLQVSFYTYFHCFPGRWKYEGKAENICNETRGDEQGAAYKEHGPVNQVVPRYNTLLHLPLDVTHDSEPLFPCIIGTQDSSEDDDENGVQGPYHGTHPDDEVKLDGWNESEKQEKSEKHNMSFQDLTERMV